MVTVTLPEAPPQADDTIHTPRVSRCRAVLYGSHASDGITWDGVVLEAETFEAQEAIRAALRDLGIRVAIPCEAPARWSREP